MSRALIATNAAWKTSKNKSGSSSSWYLINSKQDFIDTWNSITKKVGFIIEIKLAQIEQ